ncbi:MAG: tetratricopeptide repeat protein [Bdellovibrionales bacterium]|nr:tetratricopeptide repeat protein [Bdellovibrionales bacterium]
MKPLLLFAVCLSLVGCLKTRAELQGSSGSSMRTDSSGRYVTGNMDQQQRAQIDSRFFEIDRDFRQLYGKIESLEKQVADLSAKNAQPLEPATAGATATPDKVKDLEKRMSTLEEAIIALDKKVSGGAASKNEKTSFQPKQQPKGLYSVAESLYGQGKYEEAIQAYEKYRKRYPRGKKYAEATLKMGMCFQRLKMPMDAKAFYNEVIQRYPKSQTAKAAQTNIKSIQ